LLIAPVLGVVVADILGFVALLDGVGWFALRWPLCLYGVP